jgi:hypothetical protein
MMDDVGCDPQQMLGDKGNNTGPSSAAAAS